MLVYANGKDSILATLPQTPDDDNPLSSSPPSSPQTVTLQPFSNDSISNPLSDNSQTNAPQKRKKNIPLSPLTLSEEQKQHEKKTTLTKRNNVTRSPTNQQIVHKLPLVENMAKSWRGGQLFVTDRHYKIQPGFAGIGSYGAVLTAYDLRYNGTLVAIKKISKVFYDMEDAKRTLREIHILSKCDHPNVKRVLFYGTPQGACGCPRPTFLLVNFAQRSLHDVHTSFRHTKGCPILVCLKFIAPTPILTDCGVKRYDPSLRRMGNSQ